MRRPPLGPLAPLLLAALCACDAGTSGTRADATPRPDAAARDAEPFVAPDATEFRGDGAIRDATPERDAGIPDAAIRRDAAAPDAAPVRDASAAPDAAPANDDAAQPNDDAAAEDAAAEDAAAPDAEPIDAGPPFNGAGAPCPTQTECNVGWLCMNQTLVPEAPAEGFCTAICSMDADCGPDAFCTFVPQVGAGLCFSNCGGACTALPQRSCSAVLGATVMLRQAGCVPATATANDGDGCSSFAECRPNQACIVSPFTSPGGYCSTVGCTVGDDTSCASAGATCTESQTGYAACFATCTSSASCRSGYDCLPGTATSSVCTTHNSLGEGCAIDADCGPAPWRCLTDASHPGGYCTGDACVGGNPRSCPELSLCYTAPGGGNHCIRQCTSDGDCRVADGYRCLPYAAGDPSSPTGCRLP